MSDATEGTEETAAVADEVPMEYAVTIGKHPPFRIADLPNGPVVEFFRDHPHVNQLEAEFAPGRNWQVMQFYYGAVSAELGEPLSAAELHKVPMRVIRKAFSLVPEDLPQEYHDGIPTTGDTSTAT